MVPTMDLFTFYFQTISSYSLKLKNKYRNKKAAEY